MLHVLYLERRAEMPFALLMGERAPNEAEIHSLYKVVRRFKDEPSAEQMGEYLEKIFSEMQAEVWSPNCEQRELIKELGFSHTSMSTADMVFDDVNNRLWVVQSFGFKEVIPVDLDTSAPIEGNELKKLVPIHELFRRIQTDWLVPPPPSALEQWLQDEDDFDWSASV